MKKIFAFLIFISALSAKLDQWFGIYVRSYKIGYTHFVVQRTSDGYDIQETTVMDLKMLGQPKSLSTTTRVRADRHLKLKSFEFFLSTGDQKVKSLGKRSKNTVKISVEMNGRKGPSREIPAENFYVNALVHALMVFGKSIPEVFKLYDPSTFTLEDAHLVSVKKEKIKYRGKNVSATVYEIRYLGYTTRTYVYQGKIIRDEGALGIVSIEEPETLATRINANQVDLLRLFSVVPEGEVPFDARYAEIKLSNINPDVLDLTLDGQHLVKRGRDFAIIKIEIPDLGSEPGVFDIPDSVKKFLEPDEFLQSDDPRIQEIALGLTSDLSDPVQKVERIKDWVFKYLEKKPTVTIPSAVEVLESRRGDCNEHSVLFGAIARAAGIPSRVVVGLIYSNGAYFYHAWNAVWIGDRWVFVDPIFNEFPASARHIMLKTGGIDRQTEIISIVGRIKIKVLDFE